MRGERVNLTIQGQLRAFRRRRLNEIQDRSWTGSCADVLDGTTLCMGCQQFPCEGYWENALSFHSGARTTLEKWCHLEKCVWA